jgi:hypothetical protein
MTIDEWDIFCKKMDSRIIKKYSQINPNDINLFIFQSTLMIKSSGRWGVFMDNGRLMKSNWIINSYEFSYQLGVISQDERNIIIKNN